MGETNELITLILDAKDQASEHVAALGKELTGISTTGGKLGAVFGTSMAVVASVTALGFGVASKNAIALSGVVADFRAETGATAEEAKRAGDAINEMSGRNLQPIAEIGQTLAAVHTQMGLTGTAAEYMTQAMLTFAEATHQDAAVATTSFDHVLDAWNLTAKDALGVMDQLVVSHQKFGGSVDGTEAALTAAAPAMQALNLSITDGLGILNLFTASGLDAADAATAFNKSLKKVHSPEELKALIEDIRNTQDPLLRAQKAADLFGQKAGAKLANALAPGRGALSDYIVTAGDAAGASQDAADAIEGSFGNRIQLVFNAFNAKLTEIGTAVGPVGSALVAGASAARALGFSLGALGPKMAAVAVAQFALASVTLQMIPLYYAEAIAAYTAGGGVGALAVALITASIPLIAIGAVFVAVALLVTHFSDVVAGLGKVVGFVSGLLGGLGDVIGRIPGPWHNDLQAMTDDAKNFGIAVQKGLVQGIAAIPDDMREHERGIATAATDIASAAATGLGTVAPKTKIELRNWGNVIAAYAAKQRHEMRQDAIASAKAFADGLTATRNDIDTAMSDIVEGLKHPLTRAKEIAHDLGLLTSKALAAGLRSGDPAVRAAAQAEKQRILDRLASLETEPGKITKAGMNAIRAAMHSKDPEIRAEARALWSHVRAELRHPISGANVGTAWIKSLAAAINAGVPVWLARALNNVKGQLAGKSPPPKGPLRDLDTGAERVGDAWLAGLLKGINGDGLTSGLAGVSAALAGSGGSAPAFAMAAGGGGSRGLSGGATINLSYSPLIGTTGDKVRLSQEIVPELVRELRRQRLIP